MSEEQLLTDDEVMRQAAFTEGPKPMPLGITLRPVTPLSLSWMQRNNLFGDGMDEMQKIAAFIFLHSEEKAAIRAVVNVRADFLDAVDEWIDVNIRHHSQLEPFAGQMAEAFEQYMASQSNGGGIYHSDGSKN